MRKWPKRQVYVFYLAQKCQKINFWHPAANFEGYPDVRLVVSSVLSQNSDPPKSIMNVLQRFFWNLPFSTPKHWCGLGRTHVSSNFVYRPRPPGAGGIKNFWTFSILWTLFILWTILILWRLFICGLSWAQSNNYGGVKLPSVDTWALCWGCG